jgi:hypothetical protein
MLDELIPDRGGRVRVSSGELSFVRELDPWALFPLRFPLKRFLL